MCRSHEEDTGSCYKTLSVGFKLVVSVTRDLHVVKRLTHKLLVLVTAALYTTARATPGPRTRNAACMHHTIEGRGNDSKCLSAFMQLFFFKSFFNQYLLFLINTFQYF